MLLASSQFTTLYKNHMCHVLVYPDIVATVLQADVNFTVLIIKTHE